MSGFPAFDTALRELVQRRLDESRRTTRLTRVLLALTVAIVVLTVAVVILTAILVARS